jgi:hypothetical protein
MNHARGTAIIIRKKEEILTTYFTNTSISKQPICTGRRCTFVIETAFLTNLFLSQFSTIGARKRHKRLERIKKAKRQMKKIQEQKQKKI